MRDRTIPPTCMLAINLVRLQHGELAHSTHLVTTEETSVATAAAVLAQNAAALLQDGAPSGLHIVLTLNLFDEVGHGGVSWQCLAVQQPQDREALATCVGEVVSGMVSHAVAMHFGQREGEQPAATGGKVMVH